ncbi:MAG: hypothetical protein KF773_24805 [Deltaproteobacteria bacterium]|nr:hypothetical protein [Deltaproteobacteria bacterium]
MTTRRQRRKRSLVRGKRIYPFGVPPVKSTPVTYDRTVPARYESYVAERTAREAEAQLALAEADETPVSDEAQELIDLVFGSFVAGDGCHTSADGAAGDDEVDDDACGAARGAGACAAGGGADGDAGDSSDDDAAGGFDQSDEADAEGVP